VAIDLEECEEAVDIEGDEVAMVAVDVRGVVADDEEALEAVLFTATREDRDMTRTGKNEIMLAQMHFCGPQQKTT
jgi:hypothetical protein